MVAGAGAGVVWRGIVREFGMVMYTLLYCISLLDNQQGPTAQHMELNVMCQAGWEGSLGENGYMYVYS